MDQRRFDVVFSGQTVTGADPGRVRDNLARLFKTDAQAAGRLFSGARFLIKGDIDRETALKYKLAM